MTTTSPALAAEDSLPARIQAIDATLREALDARGYVALELAAALRYAVFPGGQRWRPLLTLTAAELAGARWRDALPAAAAVELVHNCSLVFDDLPAMDGAETRRGVPALHRRFGEGVAVLAGLGLLTTAYALLARSPRPRRAVSLASRYLGPAEILTGQAVDLLAGAGDLAARGVTPEVLRRVQNRKTSALVKLALQAGALHGHTTEAQRRALSRFGAEIGEAYQLMDDLHDLREDTRPRPSGAGSPEALRDALEERLDRGTAALRRAFSPSPPLEALEDFAGRIRAAAVPAAPVIAAAM